MVAPIDVMADPVTPELTGHRAEEVVKCCRQMQRRYQARDKRWDEVRAVRRGMLEGTAFAETLASDLFDGPIVANTIDNAARDLAEMTAPLPAFNCSSASMRSDAERRRAEVRTKIANHYKNHSRLAEQMLYACDQYYTHSLAIAYVEPDYEAKMPRIVFEDPYGGYPQWDRWGRVTSYTKRWYVESGVLMDLYPEHANAIRAQTRNHSDKTTDTQVELIRHWDKRGKSLVLAAKLPLLLEFVPNSVNELPLRVAKRPWLDPLHDKGQFDDVLWVQIAKNQLAQLILEGATKTIQAPIAVPPDVNQFAMGGDSLIRTAAPEKVRRVGLEMSNMGFIESQNLSQELLDGSRYPAARASGQLDASIVTGRGVQALLGTVESQVKSTQVVLREMMIDLIGLCFKMDKALWPNMKKEIRGSNDGTPYDLTYTPSTDIDSFTVDCQYGFAAGLDPNRAAVLLLQMRADGVISRDYMARQQPFALNVTEEQDKIMLEQLRDSIMQGVFMLAQSIPALATQGMDPSGPIRQAAEFAKQLQKGKKPEEIAVQVFAPPPPPEPPPQSELGGGAPPPEGAPGAPVGQPTPPGTTPTMSGQRPDLSIALAGLTSAGRPQMSNTVSRRRPI